MLNINKRGGWLGCALALAAAMLLQPAWGLAPAPAYAAESTQAITVYSVDGLQAALDSTTAEAITLSEDFYDDADTYATPITIGGIHTQAVTITGDEDKAITTAGLYILAGSVTLQDVNVSIAGITAANVKLLKWGTSNNYYGVGVLVADGVDGVTLDSCEISVTNTAGPAFTAGVIARGERLTVRDCTVSAAGASSTAGLMVFQLKSGATVTGNTLSGAHTAGFAGDQDNAPASALFINRFNERNNLGAGHPENLTFRGNTLQGGNASNGTSPTAPFSFFINVFADASYQGHAEMTDDRFASYQPPGLRPWVADPRNTSELHKLVTALVGQSGDGYGYLESWFTNSDATETADATTTGKSLVEGYDITANEVAAIDFEGFPVVGGVYSTGTAIVGRVDPCGVQGDAANGGKFHWSKGNQWSSADFTQTGCTPLTYSAIQYGGVDGKTVSDGVKITFSADLDEATAAAIAAHFVTEGGYSERAGLVDDGDGDDATWLMEFDENHPAFANGDTVKVDIFGTAGYPVTAPATEVQVHGISGTPTVKVPVDAPATDSGGTAHAVVSSGSIDAAVNNAKAADGDEVRIEINVPPADGSPAKVAVSVSVAAISSVAGIEGNLTLHIKTGAGGFELVKAALSHIKNTAQSSGLHGKDVTLSIKRDSALDAGIHTVPAGTPVFDIGITVGESTNVTEFGGAESAKNTIGMTLPYTPQHWETPANLRVWHVPEGSGGHEIMEGSFHDGETAHFRTGHLSTFVIKEGTAGNKGEPGAPGDKGEPGAPGDKGDKGDTVVAPAADPRFKIRFDANNGKVGNAPTKVYTKKKGSSISKLPKAVRKGYKFKGWYTKKKSGSLMKKITVYENATYYAHWARTAKITGAHVNLRAKANASSAVKAKVKKGATVEYLGRSGDWRKVRYGGVTGYVHKDYVKLSAT